MGLWDAILQGIIQGLTEFLPVSSSGHLSLYQHFTGQSGEAAGLFSILLHLGTLVAVCVLGHDLGDDRGILSDDRRYFHREIYL